VLPTGITQGCTFSPDGRYLAVAHATYPYITIYRRQGNSWVKTTNPVALPAALAYECGFSDDSEYLAVVNDTPTPCGYIYKRTGSIDPDFVQWAELNEIGNTGRACRFSPTIVEGSISRKYLAIGSTTGTPYLTIYKLLDVGSGPGDQLSALTLDDEPASAVYGCSFSAEGNYLAVAMSGTPYVRIYRRDGDVFTLLYGPETLPTGAGRACSYSRNGGYLAVAHDVSPYVTIYQVIGETFIKVADPATLPAGPGKACSFSRQDEYLAVAHDNTPFLTIYSIIAGVFTKLANPAVLPSSYGIDCNFATEGWIGVPWASTKPAALAFHEQRLVAARGRKQWASRTGYPQDWRQDPAQANLGYQYEFASEVLENVFWMLSKNHNVVMGTGFGEWLMTGGDQPITGANVYVERVSAHGNANISALLANESILFTQKGGQRLREFMYSEERGGYISPDLTLLADHICAQGIREMAWQRSPRSILWLVLGNGELASLTLERNHGILAWARHPMDGTVESVAVIPGVDEDVVYLVVKHEIATEGGTKPVKYIERMKPIRLPAEEEDYFFVDCGKTFDYSAVTSDKITGISKTDPVVLTLEPIDEEPFWSDERILITDVVGMTELNGNVYCVKNAVLSMGIYTCDLYSADGSTPIDGTGFGTYISGGLCEKVVNAPLSILWSSHSGAADYIWTSVTWSPELELFCAVSMNGTGNQRVQTSPDGITWTIRDASNSEQWQSVCYSPELGIFCAVGQTGFQRAMTSPDGSNWTFHATPVTNEWASVCWSPELALFCAVGKAGAGGRVMTSPDGQNWTERTAAAANDWQSICWSPELGLFCAVANTGTGNRVMTSLNGIDWISRTSAANNNWRSICWSPELGLFCAVANSGTGNRVMTSLNGIDWILRNSAANHAWVGVGWSPGLRRFCAVSPDSTSKTIMTSRDGIIWEASDPPVPSYYGSICWSPRLGIFCSPSKSGNVVMITPAAALKHLAGKTVAICADGQALANEVIVDGWVVFDSYAAKIHIGLPYTSKLWTQRLGGFSPVRIPKATLLLYKSRGGKIGADAGSLKAIRYASDTLLTGPQEVRIGGAFSRDGSIMIVQDQPLPMTVLGIVAEMSVGE
jgi:hypothetical protein